MSTWLGSNPVWQTKAVKRYGLLSLLSLMTAALIGFTVVSIWRRPDEGLNWSLTKEVTTVDPLGPAAEAGVCVGDTIIEVDGIPVAVAPRLLLDRKPGDTTTFSVVRDGQTRAFYVTLAKATPLDTLVQLEPLLIALSFWLASTMTAFLRPEFREGKLFALAGQVGAGALAAGRLSSYNVAWATSLFNASLCLLGVLLVQFHLLFPVPRLQSRGRYFLVAMYSISCVLALPYLLQSPKHFKTLSWYPWWRSAVRTFFALSVVASASLLIHAYVAVLTPRARRQVRLVTLGTAWALVPMVTLSLLPEAATGSALVPYDLTFLFLPLILVAYAIAIVRYDLFRIDRFLNRSLVHLLVGILWVTSYVALTGLLSVLFPAAMLTRPLLSALVTLFAIIPLVSLRQQVQHWVDRAFYGGWYDYRSVIADVSLALSEAQDEDVLVDQLVHGVATTMGLRGAALFLSDSSRELLLRGSTGFERSSQTRTRLSGDGPLAKQLCRKARIVQTDSLRSILDGAPVTEVGRCWLETEGVRLWLPLVFKGELRGLLLLGDKRVDDSFDPEDMRILETLAHQAALAAENVRLLDSLRRQVEELTLLRDELQTTHRQLLTSREEERNRLARELHDGLLQEFFALNIGLQSAADLPTGAAMREQLSTLQQDVIRLADATRQICAELRPPALSAMGLADAIRSYTGQRAAELGGVRVVGGFSDGSSEDRESSLTVALDLDWDRKQLADDVAIALFRVYQEALTNIEKHAAAQNVWVQERLSKGSVQLSIRDDGKGFVAPDHLGHLVRHGHFGLLGVYEQMAAVGGGAQLRSNPGGGTELVVWAPINGRGARGG